MNISVELQNNWLWQDKPYAKGQAWIDILLLASNENIYYQGKVHTLPEGQLITSENILCNRWGWSRTKVRNFLQSLVENSMLKIQADRGKSILIVQSDHGKSTLNTTNNKAEGQEKKQGIKQANTFDNKYNTGISEQGKKQVEAPMKNGRRSYEKSLVNQHHVQLNLIDAINKKSNEHSKDKI